MDLSIFKSSKVRHIAKAVTWRLIASATTFGLSIFFGLETKQAGWLAAADAVLKLVLYYGHERAWFKLDIGLQRRREKNS